MIELLFRKAMMQLKSVPNISFRSSIIVYVSFVCVWFSPYIFLGHVITPSRFVSDSNFVAGAFPYLNGILANRSQFADYLNVYIPDVAAFLDPNHYNWMNTWTDEINFGMQISLRRGHGDYYFPTWILFKLTQDPFKFLTIFTILLHAVSGVLMMLYLHTLKFHPFATLVGGLLYLTMPAHGFWSTFTIYTAVYFVLIGLLYSLHALATSPNWRVWMVLVFMVYSSVLTVYYQFVVYLAYIAFFYVLYLVFFVLSDWTKRRDYVWRVSQATVLGAVLMSPVVIDVVLEARNNLRGFSVGASPSYVPWHELFISLGYVIPTLFGERPIDSINNENSIKLLQFHGNYLTFVLFLLVVSAVMRAWHRVYGWVIALAIMFVLSYHPDAFRFSIQYLFPAISPYATIYVYLSVALFVIIAAFAVDTTMRSEPSKYHWSLVSPLVAAFGVLLIYLWSGMRNELHPRWWVFVFECTVIVIWWYVQRYIAHPRHGRIAAGALLMSVIVTAFVVVFPQMFRQPLDVLQQYPKSMMTLANYIDQDEYVASISNKNFRLAGWRCCLVLGNQGTIYNVPTIHANTSFISNQSVRLYEPFGYDVGKGRQFKHKFSIQPKYDHVNFWLMNIGAVASVEPQDHPGLQLIEKQGRFYLYDLTPKPGCCVQVSVAEIAQHLAVQDAPAAIRLQVEDQFDPRIYAHEYLTKTVSFNDYYEIPVQSTSTSLIIMNHLYHHHWQASAYVDGTWVDIDTIAVNGAFQGVFAPVNASTIRMHFVPFTLWMWVGHLFWGVTLLLIVLFHTQQLHKIPWPHKIRRVLLQ